MEGLYYFHDVDELTFLRFFPDGRLTSYGTYTRFDRHFQSFLWFTLETENVHFSRGIYQLERGNGIRIVIKWDFGKMEYRGTIRGENAIDLFSKCPFTNFGKSATFFRFSLEQHKVQIELSEIYTN